MRKNILKIFLIIFSIFFVVFFVILREFEPKWFLNPIKYQQIKFANLPENYGKSNSIVDNVLKFRQMQIKEKEISLKRLENLENIRHQNNEVFFEFF